MFKYPLAVTIDTNIFDAAKFDLSDNSTIRLLENYVKKGKIKVILSEIVIRESKKHISNQVKSVCSIARHLRADALKISTEHLIDYIGLNEFLKIIDNKEKNEYAAKGEEMFDKFISDLNAEILGTELIDLDPIIDDYFEIRPPFQEGEKKRKEFPDAFIAQQIRKRFGESEAVAIISNDDGFKKACCESSNHYFFSSLGDLYNAINKEEAAYSETISIIKEMQLRISSTLLGHIKSNENIVVRGLSYDKDGIPSGYDYDETYLHNISNISFSVHSIDEITEKKSIITLSCNAKNICRLLF